MGNFDRKKHWEQIYLTKEANELSWFQGRPEISLGFLRQNNVPTNAKIIDIGAGDSYPVDELLSLGYEDITAFGYLRSRHHASEKQTCRNMQ